MPRTRTLLTLFALTACVVNRSARPTQADSAHGVEASSLAAPPQVVASAGAPVELIPPERKDAEWVAGYWHWDGVRYVWQGGRYEPRR